MIRELIYFYIQLDSTNELKNIHVYIFIQNKSVLRIHLLLMRIRILNPHWKKMDPNPDPGNLFKIYWVFFNNFFEFVVLFFSLIFNLKLDEPFIKNEIFIFSLFKSSDLGFRSEKVFFQVFGWSFTLKSRSLGSAKTWTFTIDMLSLNNAF